MQAIGNTWKTPFHNNEMSNFFVVVDFLKK